jgi:hypothetical protein
MALFRTGAVKQNTSLEGRMGGNGAIQDAPQPVVAEVIEEVVITTPETKTAKKKKLWQ